MYASYVSPFLAEDGGLAPWVRVPGAVAYEMNAPTETSIW
jgi:hypothetical protein